MTAPGIGTPASGTFAQRHGLWSAEQAARAREIEERLLADGLTSLRLSFADQHGILRGKSLMTSAGIRLGDGCQLTSTLLLKDTSHRTVFPVWKAEGVLGLDELRGAADFVMLPDPATFRVLPWASGTAWMLCDIYYGDGTPVGLSSRKILRDQVAALNATGHDMTAGLEVEFHVFKRTDPGQPIDPVDSGHPGQPPRVGLIAQGYQYLTETRADEMDGVLELLRRNLEPLGLGLRSLEVEFGPGQLEITCKPADALATADNMVLLRSAVKQVCQRAGLHATFMCRPAMPNLFSSGWHLHQSLKEVAGGVNSFLSMGAGPLSELGLQYLGGLIAHARASSVFSTPTLNGYKRYRPFTLAPDRVAWGMDNRGTMLRVCGRPEDGSVRIENRIGEPAANPHLYIASQIVAGLDGIANRRDPGPPADAPYETPAPALPASLAEAVVELRNSVVFRSAFGDQFIDYICAIKEFEIARFQAEVTDWEMREYFSAF